LNAAGRERLASTIERQVLELGENPLPSHLDRLPWRDVGNGLTPQTLLQLFPADRPTFAIMMTSDRGGTIRVGDAVEVSD